MRLAIGQLNIQPGVPRENLKSALEFLKQAQEQGASLLTLPEMALPGYLLGDLWERPSFIKEVMMAQSELIAASSCGVTIAFGGLGLDPSRKGEDGRIRKYIAFYLAQNGQLVGPQNGPYAFSLKTLLPNYREFDDSRHFCDNRRLALEEHCPVEHLLSPHIIELEGQKISLGPMLCEDGWADDYNIKPSEILTQKGAQLLINLSSSPFTRGKNDKRDRVFGAQAKLHQAPLIYCNAVGLQNNGKTIYTFDGDSTIYNTKGVRCLQLPLFESQCRVVELENILCENVETPQNSIETIRQALHAGTSGFLKQINMDRVIIGASGGIDSAVVAALYADILPPDQLVLVNMPSRFNTATTKNAAADLARQLNCLYASVSIEESLKLTLQQLDGLSLNNHSGNQSHSLKLSGFVCENIQARDRSGRILAAIAAAFGGGFTCNANKSETCVGYSTLYGDHAGFLANIADLWKGQVYELAEHLNQRAGRELIPRSIIEVKPSAELSEQQNPELGQGDPFCYPYHDALFRSWVEDWNRKSPEEILESHMAGQLHQLLQIDNHIIEEHFKDRQSFILDLERWWKCYSGMGLAKRIQAPPILAISRRAFGFDHREAQCAVMFTQAYEKLKRQYLGA
jgi:NAD+ synthase (glutamine-hydrolysing)